MVFYRGRTYNVIIPSNVTSIGAEAFLDDHNLETVNMSANIINIGTHAFDDCTKLTSLTISEKLKTIGYGAFWYDNNLIVSGYADSVIINYCKSDGTKFYIIASSSSPSFGTPTYSTTEPTNGDVTVTIPVTGGTVPSVSHTFTENGSYTFTANGSFAFVATNAAGNVTTKTVTITNIDKTKPTVKVSIGNGKSTKGKVTVTVTDTNLKSKSVKLNGKTIAWPKNNIFKAKGKYTVTATDKAGNTATATFSIVK